MSARAGRLALGAGLAAAYALLSVLVTWPLAARAGTGLLGAPSGDTGVYIWNIWVFRHELLAHGQLPFSTEHVFSFTGGANFALHNYAPLASLVGAPLVGLVGIVGAYNLTLLTMMVANGLGTYLLARRLGLGAVAAWCAGAIFLASPVLSAKATAHFSLVIAAPLPLFLWALLRALDSGRIRDALAVGVLTAAASYADAYYGIYCLLMGLVLVGYRFLRVEWHETLRPHRWLTRLLDLVAAVMLALILNRALTGLDEVHVFGLTIGLRTLYTPVLVLVIVLLVRAWLLWQPSVRIHDGHAVLPLVERGLLAMGLCFLLLSPVLVGIAERWVTGRLPETETFWRSSPPGVDLLAYLTPNPTHPWFGERTRQWFMPDRPDAFPEMVAGFSLIAIGLLVVAMRRRLLPPLWIGFTAIFAALSLGPFIHVAGVNTYVIGPWALLRFLPVIGMARSPSRFAVVTALGLSILVAFAIDAWMRRGRAARGALLFVVLAIGVEIMPAPRVIYSAAIPDVYGMIAATVDESGRLLELPTGVRDGTSSAGNFNPASEFFQTLHQRPMVGGYLSRISQWRRNESERTPMLRALFALSEGRSLTAEEAEQARLSRAEFMARSCVRFVVVDKRQASPELQAFAATTLSLTPVYEDESYALLEPDDPPPCRRPPGQGRRSMFAIFRGEP